MVRWPKVDICIKFLLNVVCQKLLKLASVSRRYSKIIVAHFYGRRYIKGNTVFELFIQTIFNCCI